MNPTWGRDYWGLVGTDLILGLLSFTAGWAFRRGKNGSWAATCLFWGAGTAISSAITMWLLPFEAAYVWRHQYIHPRDFLSDSRFGIYVLTMIAGPYVLWKLLVQPEPPRPSRLTHWAWTMAGAAGALGSFFIWIYRP